jgi:hypothetical protein
VIILVIIHHQVSEIQLVSIFEEEAALAAAGALPQRFFENAGLVAGSTARAKGLEPGSELRLGAQRFVSKRLEVEAHRVWAHAGQEAHAHVDLEHPATRREPPDRRQELSDDGSLVQR